MLDNLYENIGKKIKIWAKWIFIIEAIGSIITGIVLLIDNGLEDGWWSLFIIVFGPIVAWVCSWILYGFGELIEKTCDNEYNTKRILKMLNETTPKSDKIKTTPIQTDTAKSNPSTHKWRCDGCGNMRTQSPCEFCGNE